MCRRVPLPPFVGASVAGPADQATLRALIEDGYSPHGKKSLGNHTFLISMHLRSSTCTQARRARWCCQCVSEVSSAKLTDACGDSNGNPRPQCGWGGCQQAGRCVCMETCLMTTGTLRSVHSVHAWTLLLVQRETSLSLRSTLRVWRSLPRRPDQEQAHADLRACHDESRAPSTREWRPPRCGGSRTSQMSTRRTAVQRVRWFLRRRPQLLRRSRAPTC